MSTQRKPPPVTQEQLRARRDAILKLAALQRRLRAALTAELNMRGITVTDIAKETGLTWSEVNRAVNGTTAICSNKILTALVAVLSRNTVHGITKEFASEVLAAADGLSDRVKGTALFSERVIRLAYEIQIVQLDRASDFNFERFGKLFGEHAAIVASAMVNAKEALQQLEDSPDTCEAITVRLADPQFDNAVAQARAAHNQDMQRMSAELKALDPQLLERFGGRRPLAAAFKVSPSAYTDALSGHVSEDLLTHILARAYELVAQDRVPPPQDPNEDQEATVRRLLQDTVARDVLERMIACLHDRHHADTPSAQIPRTKQTPSLARLLAEIAPHTSALGVPMALTESTFSRLDWDPRLEAMPLAKQCLTMVIGLLNLLTKTMDDGIRSQVQRELAKYAEELFVALKLFAHEVPTRYLPVMDAQRTAFAQQPFPPRTPRRR